MRKISRRKLELRIESLEDRRVLATWGIPWADPQHLTASFVPDGTSLPGGTSNLYQLLNGQLGSGDWEVPILKALQTWAVNSNINIGVVSDGGEPVGVAGLAQSDARFGDIRISAEPLSSDVLAITTPYSPANGTLSGDIIINSNDDFNPSDAGSVDLYTVILHEAGHVFSFADSSDPSSFMYNVYQGPRAGISSAAVTAIQNLYGGARNIDALDGNAVGTTPSNAVSIPSIASNGTSVTVLGDVASASTTNDYLFHATSNLAANALGLDVTVQTGGVSLLTPEVTVYTMGLGNTLGTQVATASASSPLAGGATVHLNGLVSGQKYMIQVHGATGDVFSVGSYSLTVSETGAISGGSNPTSGSKAVSESSGYNGATPLTVADTITGTTQVNVYSFQTPATLSAVLSNVTVGIQDWGFGVVAPSVGVYNSLGFLVGSATASSAGGSSVSVGLTNLTPAATYYVRVTNGTINALDFGTYQLTVAFGSGSTAQATSFVPATPWYGAAGAAPVSNTSMATAATLATPADEAPDSRYDAIDGVDLSSSARFYSLTAPATASGQGQVMTVSVQTLGTDALAPAIMVYDQNGNPLNVQDLTDENGIAVGQVALPTPGAPYYVEVASSQQVGASLQGNYVLDTTFGSTMAVIGPIASGTLAPSVAGSPMAAVTSSFLIGQGGLYAFDLAGTTSNPSTDAMIQMTLSDSSGVVATLSTPAGLAESAIVSLAPGLYTVEIGAYSPSGEAIPALSYTLDGFDDTDPLKGTIGSGSGGGAK